MHLLNLNQHEINILSWDKVMVIIQKYIIRMNLVLEI